MYHEEGSWERMWRRQEARADLAQKLWELTGGRPGWRVADVGCGPGLFSLLYAGLTGPTGHVHAIDTDPGALAFLRTRMDAAQHAHVTTERLDIARHPLPDLAFHALFCSAMLHHVADVPQALRNLRLAKAPLVIAEYDPSGPCETGPPREARIAPRDLRAALRAAGWSPEVPVDLPDETYAIVARP